MEESLKSGLVVLVLLLPAFLATKRLALEHMSAAAWTLRVRTYLLVAGCAFCLPSFWLFAVASFLISLQAFRRETNRAALLLLLLFAVPPYSLEIPTGALGIGRLLDLNHYRILCLAALASIAFHAPARMRGRLNRVKAPTQWLAADVALLGFIALNTILYFPLDSITGVLRRLLLNLFDYGIPYFLLRHLLMTREQVREALACLALGTLVLVPIALFETFKYWSLYFAMIPLWGSQALSYLARDGVLRAVATGGHAIPFGYLMGCGVILYGGMLQRKGLRSHALWAALAALACGASFSRGPWVSTAVGLAVFYLLAGRAFINLGKVSAIAAAGLLLLLVTPNASRLLDYLPFIGSVEEGNIDYRVELARTSWRLILHNPLFGNPFFLQNMEHLRQGQGIIDLVNTYSSIALSTGLVGAGLFSFVLLCGAFYPLRTLRKGRRPRQADPYERGLACGLAALSLCTIVVIGTCSMIGVLSVLPWCLAGTSSALLLTSRREALLGARTDSTTDLVDVRLPKGPRPQAA